MSGNDNLCQANEGAKGDGSSHEGALQSGESGDAGIRIDRLGGNCPVQARGLIDGEPFYFRARWDSWELCVGSDEEDTSSIGVYGRNVVDEPRWRYGEDYGDGPYDAGWMPEETAREMIAKGAALYRAEAKGKAESAICPLCNGTGFRSTDGGPDHQICECIDLDDDEDCGFGQCEKCGMYHVDDFGCYRCRQLEEQAQRSDTASPRANGQPDTRNYEEQARKIVCVPGFCGCADDMAAGMSEEDASGHTDHCRRLQVAFATALTNAVQAEREACAEISDAHAIFARRTYSDQAFEIAVITANSIARTIRSRGETSNG